MLSRHRGSQGGLPPAPALLRPACGPRRRAELRGGTSLFLAMLGSCVLLVAAPSPSPRRWSSRMDARPGCLPSFTLRRASGSTSSPPGNLHTAQRGPLTPGVTGTDARLDVAETRGSQQ
jgi:hypothetical protein